jgi:hypothetical protein
LANSIEYLQQHVVCFVVAGLATDEPVLVAVPGDNRREVRGSAARSLFRRRLRRLGGFSQAGVDGL